MGGGIRSSDRNTERQKIETRLPVFSINRLRMGIDGEGVVTLVGVHGCPLRCKYCLNKAAWRNDIIVQQFTCEELYDAVKEDDLYFRATGGGVTFGGGEAILHSHFIKKFKEKYAQNWNIVLETALNVPSDYVKEAVEGVDFFIIDCKDMNEKIYKDYTGKTSKLVKQNLEYLLDKAGNHRMRVKVPLIPKYNQKADVEKSVQKLQQIGINSIQQIEYVVR